MIEVIPKDNTKESFEKAFSIFKKICDKGGFLQELRDRKYYKKPSEKRREKRGKRKYNAQGEK